MTWIAPALSTIGVAVAFALFRRLYRGRTERLAAAVDPDELERRWGRFAKIDAAVGVVAVLGLGGGGTVAVARLLHGWIESIHAARPGAIHHVSLSVYYWAICAAPLVLAVLVPLGIGVYRLLLKERFAEYRVYSTLRHGYDAIRVVQILLAALLLLAAVAFPLGVDTYALATVEEVVIDPYFGLAETARPYADVASIHVRIKAKKRKWLRSYRIAFADGTEWRSEQLHVEIGAPPPGFISEVAARSGRPVEQE